MANAVSFKRTMAYVIVLAICATISLWQIDRALGYGGGGGSSTPPAVVPQPGQSSASVIINGGAKQTENTKVALKLPSTSADQMAISNSADFENATWQSYKAETDWTLKPGTGDKTVYVKFRTSANGSTSAVYTGTIQLTGSASDVVAPTPTPIPASVDEVSTDVNNDGVIDQRDVSILISEKPANCPVNTRTAYKASDASGVYYITLSCTKRPFNNPAVFFTYFTSWSEVNVTTQAVLDQIENDALGFMPWGHRYDPKYGALVKTVSDPKVYLLLNGKKFWITSESVFATLGYKWEWVEDIAQTLLEKYETAGEITRTDRHEDGTLVKYANSPKVYRIVDGKKSHIATEEVFARLGYRLDRIVTIADSEQYEDGPAIN